MIIDMERKEIIMEDKKKTFGEKAKEFGEKVKDGFSNGLDWVKEHPKEFIGILTAGTAIVGGVGRIANGINKRHVAKQEQYNKERFVYDHSAGAYLKTKHKLTANDVKAINALRRNTGMKMSEAMEELDLLE